MKKNIIIAILAITSILSIIYGRYQKTEALKQAALAADNAKLAREATVKAEEHLKLAREQRDIALANAAEALRQAQIANESIKKKATAR